MTVRDRSGMGIGGALTRGHPVGRRSRVPVAILLPMVVVSGLGLATWSGDGAAAPAAPAAQAGAAGAGEASAFCSTAQKVLALEVGLERGQLVTAQEGARQVRGTDEVLDALVAQAPADLRAPTTVVRASTQRVVAELARVDYDASKMDRKTIFAVTGEPGYLRAAREVVGYVHTNCGGVPPASGQGS